MMKHQPKPGMLPAGTNYCFCAACGEYFRGVTGFDRHRKDGKCLEPGSIVRERGNRAGEPYLALDAQGYWRNADLYAYAATDSSQETPDD